MTEEILRRDDKISLSGGKKVLWAPQFPRYAHKLGFWDYAYFLNYPIAPLFTVTILDEKLNEIPLNRIEREWLPSHLTQYYKPFHNMEFSEQKALLSNDVLVSRITLRNCSSNERTFRVIAWTSQVIQENIARKNPEKTPNANYIETIENSERLFSFQRRINNPKGNLMIRYGIAIGSRRKADSFSISTSEYIWNYPEWKLTPFYEKITPEGLPNDAAFKGMNPHSDSREMIYLALEYRIVLSPKSSHDLHIYCAIRDELEEAMDALVLAVQFPDVINYAANSWQKYFEGVPQFQCSNAFIEKYYWYRWFGLRKNMVNTDNSLGLVKPCLFEGTNPEELRHQTSLSTPAQMLETRWMHDPIYAKGSLLNMIANQRRDGSFPGVISTAYHTQHEGFYHANWGRAIRELYRVHPDAIFLEEIYAAMKKYIRYFAKERDKNFWHLYDILDPREIGPEYASRYLFISRRGNKIENIPLKGVDASVYIYELFRTLAWMSKKLGLSKDSVHWQSEAAQVKSAILKYMWNDQVKFFFDINPYSGHRSPYKTAAGFFPFMTDIAQTDHLAIFTEHLFDPDEFWLPFPVPATSMDDTYANAYGEWQNVRRERPGNGRTWMILNSHVCEALARAAQHFDHSLKSKAAEFLFKFVNVLFIQGDVNYPISYEYVNPLNGKPPYFRGSDDHINFWMVDLIIKYVVGLQPLDDGIIVIDPLPLGLDFFILENVKVKGHLLKVTYGATQDAPVEPGLLVYVDDEIVAKKTHLERIQIEVVE